MGAHASQVLLILGLIFAALHAVLLGAWFAEADMAALCMSAVFLVIGFAMIWASRRMSVRRLGQLGVRYGRAYIGCAWSGLSLLDVAGVYLLTFIVTMFVALLEGELDSLRELWAAMYFVLTLVFCITYPIFYHPHASLVEEAAGLLEALRRELGAVSFGYARGVGLLARLGGGTIALVSLPPFAEATPFIPLVMIDNMLLEEGEMMLSAELTVVRFKSEPERYRSLFSLLGWPRAPRLRLLDKEARDIETAEGTIAHVARGIMDLPDPDDARRRLRGEAIVAWAQLSRRKLKKVERSPRYAVNLILRVLRTMLEEIETAACGRAPQS